MFKRFVVSGTKKNDVLTGTDRSEVLRGKNGNDVLFGGDGDDFLFGGNGNDKLFGGDGDDKLFGGNGNDFLDGGAGSDYLFGDKGNDTFNFNMSENAGSKDFYDGGKGFDTLQLTLTSAELKQESVQKDIADFEAFLARKGHGDDGNAFQFKSFDLNVRNFQDLKIVEVGGGNTAPVANPDLGVLVSEDAVDFAIDVLANDTDADGDRLSLVTAVVVADGLGTAAVVGNQVVYNPGDAYQFLGAGASANVKIDYTISDEHGATASSFVDVLVTGVNDDPVAEDDPFTGLTATKVVSPINVAVIGGAASSFGLAVDQLNDAGTTFNAEGFSFASVTDWSDFDFDRFDVVVLGGSGLELDYGAETGLFQGLNSFVASGGGVVTTGFFALELRSITASNDLSAETKMFADNITPIAPGWSDIDVGRLNAQITVSDPNHEIVRGVADANNVYLSNAQWHEFAPNLDRDSDGNLVVNQLATGTNQAGAEVTAIAYDVEVGRNDAEGLSGGNTVYLGGTYLANTFFGTGPGSGIRDPEGVSDQIFEQAIAWAAGARGTATVSIDTADLLANDTDVDSPRGDFTIERFTQPGAEGASIALVGGILVYTLGAQSLQALEAGLTVEDSFNYTMSDGAGGFDTASVSLSIDTLL